MIEINEIIQMKLSSGEEIIGKCVNKTKKEHVFLGVLMVDRSINAGQIYFTLKSWMLLQFEDNRSASVTINNDNLTSHMIPSETMLKNYASTLEFMTNIDDIPDTDFDDDYPELQPAPTKYQN